MAFFKRIGLSIRRGGQPSGGSSAFNPLDIVGLRAWYDFSDTDTIFSDFADLVSIVLDKSGNDYNLMQFVGGNQPTTNTRTINGLNALDFTGNAFLEAFSKLGLGSNPEFSIISVFKNDVSTGFPILACLGGAGVGSGSLASIEVANTGFGWRFGNGNEIYTLGASDDTLYKLWAIRPDDGEYQDSRMQIDGNELTRASGGGDTNKPNFTEYFSVGAGVNNSGGVGNSPMEGAMGELMVVDNNALSQKTDILNYLVNKWGS